MHYTTIMRKYIFSTTILLLSAVMLLYMSGCTAEEPDTSAPQRKEIERTADWQGALLYVADEVGPVDSWGSIRVYDNVSGFVEETVEQTLAAGPSDVYVTGDGSTMYVSSLANGRVDQFHWNGNNWSRGNSAINSPALSLLTLAPAPGGLLYVADGDSTGDGRFFILNPETGRLDDRELAVPDLTAARGISWAADGSQAFISGISADGPVLLKLSWPAKTVSGSLALPVPQPHQVVTSLDGASLFVMGQGTIIRVDPATMTILATIQPSGSPATEYMDGAFSADGRYLFTAGTEPGADSTLYVINLANLGVVHTVPHVSARANGIQRVE
ncbi:hypothetical protein BMS3Abin01_00950 [bacterium BMS3Abin01]|nr:hypothetical protein BMS3Abin01_00950 [bacterium BMS3Abin01]HDZ59702.1 hypothetical protein [Actinomycetota bacterium]